MIPKAAAGPPQNDACLLRFRLTGEQLLTTLPPTPNPLLVLIGDDEAAVVTTSRGGRRWQALEPAVAAADSGPSPCSRCRRHRGFH